jgi:RNA polymerase sigma factor (sigma-70 family)
MGMTNGGGRRYQVDRNGTENSKTPDSPSVPDGRGAPVAGSVSGEADWTAARFSEHRVHLRSVAYRMLGSLPEADDAVQEAWLRLSRADASEVANLRAWLTTVVSRVCLDMLRARTARREDPLDVRVPDPIVAPLRRDVLPGGGGAVSGDPEEQAVLADSVGLALLVVLDTLSPAERLAFVLHDIFAVPFDQIGSILDRSPAAAKQLASRARSRLHGAGAGGAAGLAVGEANGLGGGKASSPADESPGAAAPRRPDPARQWEVLDAFLAAAREGDFGRLLAILDPDVVLRADAGTGPLGPSQLVRGAQAVIAQAHRFSPLARFGHRVLVNGDPGFLIARGGRALAVASVTVADGQITEINILADPDRLHRLDLTGVLPQ